MLMLCISIPSPAKAQSAVSDNDLRMLSQLVWNEARCLPQDEQALVIWTVLQRVDAGGAYGTTIKEVLNKKGQFTYNRNNPVDDAIYELCQQETQKWLDGGDPPTLDPYAKSAPYYFFVGDGKHNYFREKYK